jgi:acetylornithine deacetylase/succinyl-diaminopimelate desuccinylase-like protein
VAHTDDEYVELDALRQAVGIYERLAIDGLARQP